MSVPMIHMWKGRDINELDREELLEVVQFLAEHYAEHTSPEHIRAHALGSAQMLVRGIDHESGALSDTLTGKNARKIDWLNPFS